MAQASLDHGIACSHFRGLLLSCLPLLVVVASSTYQRRPGKRYRVLVSYMEVYKESVYDLLDTNSRNKPLEEWTKVTNSCSARICPVLGGQAAGRPAWLLLLLLLHH